MMTATNDRLARESCVPRWWLAPGLADYPPLRDEQRLTLEAAQLLATGRRPWKVARELGRKWPQWRLLMPELVRGVLDRTQAEVRNVA